MLARRVSLVAASLAVVAFILTQAAEARTNTDTAKVRLASLSTVKSGDCCAPQPVCCPKPCIIYHHRGPKLCCGSCDAPVETILKVKDPCTGCEVEVPVCLPACCKGEPTVCCGVGFLGRDIVDYEWCCGFSVRVAFKKHSGDLIVTTWGR